jgi:hypothetical protein
MFILEADDMSYKHNSRGIVNWLKKNGFKYGHYEELNGYRRVFCNEYKTVSVVVDIFKKEINICEYINGSSLEKTNSVIPLNNEWTNNLKSFLYNLNKELDNRISC